MASLNGEGMGAAGGVGMRGSYAGVSSASSSRSSGMASGGGRAVGGQYGQAAHENERHPRFAAFVRHES